MTNYNPLTINAKARKQPFTERVIATSVDDVIRHPFNIYF